MTQLDPIIAVKNVEASAQWYQSVFDCKRTHGGDEFAILESEGEVLVCLHKWGAHEHPTMIKPNDAPSNGLILYFRTANMKAIRENVAKMGHPVETEIQKNPNSGKMEFSLRDLDGYYLTISEFHKYEG